MKLRFLGTAVVALVASACAIDANDPAGESGSVEGSAPAESAASIAAPVHAANDANLEELRLAAKAANRTQLVVAANANLVAEAPAGAAGKVYFVESDAGIAMFEAQRVGDPSALAELPADLSALQAYQLLQPNGAVPEALSKAQLRVDQLKQNGVRRENTAPTVAAEPASEGVTDLVTNVATRGEVAATRQAVIDDSLCPGTWFQTTQCDFWRTGKGTCSMWKTNTGTYKNYDTDWVYTNACSYRGNITHRLRQDTWGSWNLVGLWTVAPGYYSTITYSSNFWDFDYESKVYDADGDGWHHAAQWR